MPRKKSKYSYRVAETKDLSNGGARRLAIKVLLEQEYTKDELKEILLELTNKYKKYKYKSFVNVNPNKTLSDIIWLYIANNKKHLEECNYTCRTQWINKDLNNKYTVMFKWNDEHEGIKILWRN